jgi:hypothetical protein
MNTISRLLILSFILLLSGHISGKDKLKNGFDDLSIYNYFGAKENFENVLKKRPCGAAYGLSLIYINQKNPFYNIDSARVYALKSEGSWIISSEKERSKLSLLGVDSIAIQAQLKEIAEQALAKAMIKNRVEDYELFITDYGYSSLVSQAIQLRNQRAFELVKETNTSRAYKTFMQTYPNSKEYGDAKNRYERAVFEENNTLKDITLVEEFIKEHPNSPYLGQAQDNLYKLSTSSGKLDAYLSFIEKYPSNPNVEAAWQKIYQIETEKLSPEVLADFLMEYPDYPMKEKVRMELSNLLKVLIPATMNSKWGYIDTLGNWIIRPIYESCEPFSEGMALISRDQKFGFINTNGNEIILTEYEDAESFNKGLAIVFNGEKYGAVNRFGDKIIKPDYDDIGEFKEGVAYASKDGKYGYIDEKGFVLIPFIYDQAFSFEYGKALVKYNSKYGIVDKANKRIVPFDYDWIEPHYNDSIFKVRKDTEYGLFSFQLDTLLQISYDQIGNVDQELILVVKEDKVGYVNSKGELIIPMSYEADPSILTWGEFDNGLARIKIKGKMGIIDSIGTRVVPAIFEMIGEYDGILYPVKKYNKWGFADDKIKLIINYKYSLAYPFQGDFARVSKNNKWGFIDREGKTTVPIEYSKIVDIEGVYIIQTDSSYGMMDYATNLILEPVFDNITYNELGFFELSLNGKLAYLDINRRKVFWKESGFEMESGE